jgi:hypothetical protein
VNTGLWARHRVVLAALLALETAQLQGRSRISRPAAQSNGSKVGLEPGRELQPGEVGRWAATAEVASDFPVLATTPAPERTGVKGEAGDIPWRNLAAGPWPLLCILAVQAVLSLRLVWSNTAFEDEALYLWAGHQEWSHWLHGTTILPFATYFSGAPVIYPPIGALADSIGGLAGARILSLGFMLGATTFLYFTAKRLTSRRAALFAAGLFAVPGPTIRLGAFATYDAMALFLIALAAFFATGGGARQYPMRWLYSSVAALVLANATKYASALFDPVVVALAVLAGFPRPGGKAAWRRGAFIAAATVLSIMALLQIGGQWYSDGIGRTTTARTPAGTPVMTVLQSSWDWTAVALVIAAAGVGICLITWNPLHRRLLMLTLLGTGLLVPAEQARIHTFTSLSKHVDFGLWFSVIVAGYAIDWALTHMRARWVQAWATAACVACAGPLISVGLSQAVSFYGWDNISNLVVFLKPLTDHGGRFLADNSPPLEYYLSWTSYKQWSSAYGITLPSGRRIAEGTDSFAPFRPYLSRGYFSLVVLAFSDRPDLDVAIASYLSKDPEYRFLGKVRFANPGSTGSYLIWRYEPTRGHRDRAHQ